MPPKTLHNPNWTQNIIFSNLACESHLCPVTLKTTSVCFAWPLKLNSSVFGGRGGGGGSSITFSVQKLKVFVMKNAKILTTLAMPHITLKFDASNSRLLTSTSLPYINILTMFFQVLKTATFTNPPSQLEKKNKKKTGKLNVQNRCKTKVTRPTSMSLWKRQRLGLIYHKNKTCGQMVSRPWWRFQVQV